MKYFPVSITDSRPRQDHALYLCGQPRASRTPKGRGFIKRSVPTAWRLFHV